MNQELLTNYAALCAQIKELETKKGELQAEVLAHLRTVGKPTLQTQFGTFTVAVRQTWQYTDAIKEREKTLDEAKKVEREVGAAKATETEYVRYQAGGAKV